MMGGSPSWWSMHSDLRSSSTSDHHQSVAPNLLLSQTHPYTTSDHPNHHHHNLLHPLNNINIHNSSTSSSPSSSSSSSSSSTSSLLPFSSLAPHHHDRHRPQDFPHSWSQLLLGGLVSEQEERFGPSLFQSTRVMGSSVDDVKQEVTSPNNNNNNNNLFGYHNEGEQEAGVSNRPTPPWSLTIPISSPKSCITSLSSNSNNNINNNNNMLDFSTSKISLRPDYQQQVDHSNSECNSTTNGGIPNKKPKVQSSSNPPLKVRKEKLGDRITALHQLVSPFGKTDTASVLLEAIGYIRFLQGQIEALSTPYMGNNSASNQHSVHGERNCLFPDHPGQLLNDSCLKRRGAATQEDLKDASRDLKSRGLCLVPISCTQLVGSDNGADYWAPSLGGGF